MSKNIKLNGTEYNGVSTVQLPTTSGGTASFKDMDEITTPSGTKTITENGTYDVTNFAQVVVGVETSGDSVNSENSYEMGTFTLNEVVNNYTYEHRLGRVPKFAIVYPISVEKATDDSTLHSKYTISSQYILNGLGQEDYNIANNNKTARNNPFALYYGTNYAINADGTYIGANTNEYSTHIEFTENHVTVGKQTEVIESSGKFGIGTYGIIVG